MSIASLLAVATIAYTSSDLESGSDLYVSTPHGLRLKKCVHAIPENARVHEHADGLMVHLLESGSAYLISHDKECEAEAEGMARQRRETNQWQDDTGFHHEGLLNFTAIYTAPEEYPPDEGQLLYYFIGLENSHGPLTIVQPVVRYDKTGHHPDGWSMAPWNCCPKGQSLHGKTVPTTPGVPINTWIYTTADGKVEIGMERLAEGPPAKSSFTVPLLKRDWTYAVATLETYKQKDCASTTSRPFHFTEMKLSDSGGPVTPKWSAGMKQTACKGGATIHGPSSVDLYGAKMPESA